MDKYQPLFSCIEAGNDEELSRLLKEEEYKNWSEEAKSSRGYPLLHLSVHHKSQECIKLLVKQGANMNQKDATGRAPLHIAVEVKDIDCVKLLIQLGSKVNPADSRGATPLVYAERLGLKDIGRFLLEKGGLFFKLDFKFENEHASFDPSTIHILILGKSQFLNELSEILADNKFNIWHGESLADAVEKKKEMAENVSSEIDGPPQDIALAVVEVDWSVHQQKCAKEAFSLEPTHLVAFYTGEAPPVDKIHKFNHMYRCNSVFKLDDSHLIFGKIKVYIDNAWAQGQAKILASRQNEAEVLEARVKELEAQVAERDEKLVATESELKRVKKSATSLVMRIMVLEGQKRRSAKLQASVEKEVQEMKKKVQAAMETPVQTLSRILQDLQTGGKKPDMKELQASLSNVVDAVKEGSVYEPNLEKLEIEAKGKDWLMGEFTKPKSRRASVASSFSAPSSASSNAMPRRFSVRTPRIKPMLDNVAEESSVSVPSSAGPTRDRASTDAEIRKIKEALEKLAREDPNSDAPAILDDLSLPSVFGNIPGVEGGAPVPFKNKDLALPPLPQPRTNYILPSVNVPAMVAEASKLEFNLWQFLDEEKQKEMLDYIVAIFKDLEFLDTFKIPIDTLYNFLEEIRKNYRANPYHNFFHAFDVFQTCFVIMQTMGGKKLLSPVEQLASLVGALCHDLDHPGLNNAFQMNILSDLAITYNDASVLESYHCACAFRVLQKENCNIFKNLTGDEFKDARRTIIHAILGTDMANHFEIVSKLSTQLDNQGPLDTEDENDRQMFSVVMVHAADISNQCKPWDIAYSWSNRVGEEFHAQGDLERANGWPISPYCDRNDSNQSSMSVNFINFVVSPLYTLLCRILPDAEPFLKYMNENLSTWEERDVNTAPAPTPSKAELAEAEKKPASTKSVSTKGSSTHSAAKSPNLALRSTKFRSSSTKSIASTKKKRMPSGVSVLGPNKSKKSLATATGLPSSQLLTFPGVTKSATSSTSSKSSKSSSISSSSRTKTWAVPRRK